MFVSRMDGGGPLPRQTPLHDQITTRAFVRSSNNNTLCDEAIVH